MTTAWGGVLPKDNSQGRGDSFYYLLAAGAGVLAGWVDIKITDLLFTALLVMVPAMLLGFLRAFRGVAGLSVPEDPAISRAGFPIVSRIASSAGGGLRRRVRARGDQ